MNRSVAHALALSRIDGVGPVLFKRLLTAFGEPHKVFEAEAADLERLEGVSSKGAGLLKERLSREPAWAEIERELEEAHRLGIQILHWGSPDYPSMLAAIHDPPPVLYAKGTLTETDNRAVAIVGTRKPTPYGDAQTRQMAADLAAARVTVISGLALGVDGLAHRSALDAGGRTIAVLGSGLANVYPREHQSLFDAITANGCVLSEFPPETSPEGRNFPQRNRVISGLSLGVLVIEAGEQSGSLISARFALEQGRDVYALPGNVTSPYSRGTNRLIRQGARLVESASDILEDLSPLLRTEAGRPAASPRPAPAVLPLLDENEAKIADLLGSEPLHLDMIARESGMPPAGLPHLMLQLELKGLAQAMGGGYYIAARR